MRKWMLVALVIAVVVAIPLACIVFERITAPSFGNDSVVLIEHLSQSRGRLVNGTYPAPEMTGKSYAYDAARKALDGGGLVVNDTLQAVLAVSRSLTQDAGTGADGAAYGIYDIPAATEGIALHDVATDGTVTLTYNGSRIVLAPGERWELISTDTVSTPDYSIKLIKSDSIRNDGILPKSAIR
jgi:hypothetical protein